MLVVAQISVTLYLQSLSSPTCSVWSLLEQDIRFWCMLDRSSLMVRPLTENPLETIIPKCRRRGTEPGFETGSPQSLFVDANAPWLCLSRHLVSDMSSASFFFSYFALGKSMFRDHSDISYLSIFTGTLKLVFVCSRDCPLRVLKDHPCVWGIALIPFVILSERVRVERCFRNNDPK